MDEEMQTRLTVTGHPTELRALELELRGSEPALRVEFVRKDDDPDSMGYDAVTALLISVTGSVSSRLAYDLLVWAWKTARARGLNAEEPAKPTEPPPS